MATEYMEHPPHLRYQDSPSEPGAPISVSHFIRVIRSYSAFLLLALAAVVIAYLIIATGAYLFSPTAKITYQSFRLDFDGAGRGEYPNKMKFNIADIINGPILARVWQDDHLEKYISFGAFSRAVYVLESNSQYEQLAAEYQAKLADTKLSSVDRERLQEEFEMKRQSIVKNEYAIYFDRNAATNAIPEPLARKILLDILNEWAGFAVNQQHVMAYEVSVLSPDILKPTAIEQSEAIVALEVLRSKVNRVLVNLKKIEKLPGATLVRTPGDRMSIEEVRIRLDDIVRFRLEPLLSDAVHSPSVIDGRATTIRFLEGQLAYDQRQLDSAQRLADSSREALTVYERPVPEGSVAATVDKRAAEPQKGETVTPQLSDTFLDRLLTLTGRASDAQYRQGLIEDYRKAIAETIPLKQAVSYDIEMLNELKAPSGGAVAVNPATMRVQIEQSRADIGQMIAKMNELFQIVSRNMTPSTQLFTLTSPPVTHTIRSMSLQRSALYGVLVVLVTLPVLIAVALLHNRIREEKEADDFLRHQRPAGAETTP